MGDYDNSFVLQQWERQIRWFGVEDVQCEASDRVILEGGPRGVVVDKSAAGRVDQHRVWEHPAQAGAVDHVMSLFGKGAVQRNDIAGAEQVFEGEHLAVGAVVVA